MSKNVGNNTETVKVTEKEEQKNVPEKIVMEERFSNIAENRILTARTPDWVTQVLDLHRDTVAQIADQLASSSADRRDVVIDRNGIDESADADVSSSEGESNKRRRIHSDPMRYNERERYYCFVINNRLKEGWITDSEDDDF